MKAIKRKCDRSDHGLLAEAHQPSRYTGLDELMFTEFPLGILSSREQDVISPQGKGQSSSSNRILDIRGTAAVVGGRSIRRTLRFVSFGSHLVPGHKQLRHRRPALRLSSCESRGCRVRRIHSDRLSITGFGASLVRFVPSRSSDPHKNPWKWEDSGTQMAGDRQPYISKNCFRQ